MLELTGWKLLTIPVTRDGFVTPEAVLETVREDTAFVAVMAVNNETGAIQPVSEIARALSASCAGRKRPHFHVDAVQAAGKIPFDFSMPGLDSAAISGHKLMGPHGIGLLYLHHRFEPFIRGGGQESGLRPGTENLAGAWALSRCLEKSIGAIPEGRAQDVMECLIRTVTAHPGVSVIPASRTARDPRFSPWILQCTNDRLPGEVLVRALSDRGICISTGSACSSRKKNRPVLQAMHVPPALQQNAFRLSIGPGTGIGDIESLGAALGTVLSGKL